MYEDTLYFWGQASPNLNETSVL